ncbi:MAG: zinc-ribbon domain-containing protein [Chitinophagaceae bacterium]|nr:zinc-ribbon domain-containing protein [Chitinophagaceae bacterium]MCW5927172.1 zinc-ribbon domain-containing protein [Chitinophagaceae bacterium]
MFLIHGKRNVIIKTYSNNLEYCKECRAFDLHIMIYQEYYHFFFIPFFPVGAKTAHILCNNCAARAGSSQMRMEYEKQTRSPIWMYTGAVLILGIPLFAIISNLIIG